MLIWAAEAIPACPALCNPMDHRPPGSSVHGILQARILEWVAIPPPGDLPDPGIKPESLRFPALAGGFFTTSPPVKPSTYLYHGLSPEVLITSQNLKDKKVQTQPSSLVPEFLLDSL